MKKNNQGFMLVEALVMSVVIIGVLVFMFIQFRNISRSYDRSFNYNTVHALYYTNELKNWLVVNEELEFLESELNSNDYFYVVEYIKEEDDIYIYYQDTSLSSLVINTGIKTAIFAKESLVGLKSSYHSEFSEEFNDYINYVKVNSEEGKYRLVVEFYDGTFASLSLGGE